MFILPMKSKIRETDNNLLAAFTKVGCLSNLAYNKKVILCCY